MEDNDDFQKKEIKPVKTSQSLSPKKHKRIDKAKPFRLM